MSTFVGIPPFSNPLWVATETMHLYIARTNFFRTPSFRIQGVPLNNFAPMKNCPGDARSPKLDAGVQVYTLFAHAKMADSRLYGHFEMRTIWPSR